MNRGSVDLGRGAGAAERASMRPRFMNRGSVSRSAREPAAVSRFNEAPIHESGKCMSSRSAGPWPVGFNEAPIHESGK